MRGLGLGLGLSGGSLVIVPGASQAMIRLFGAALVLAVDSDHVTNVAGNATVATDLSGAGNNLTHVGTAPISTGGVKGRPFVTMANGIKLSTATNIIATSGDRTVYHVFQALAGIGSVLRFKTAAPDFVLRYHSSPLYTTSDDSAYNGLGTYTFDTTNVHILEGQYHLGAANCPYYLDGALITQTGTLVSADSGTAGFEINGGALSGGQIWYATYVVNRLTTGPEDTAALAALQAAY